MAWFQARQHDFQKFIIIVLPKLYTIMIFINICFAHYLKFSLYFKSCCHTRSRGKSSSSGREKLVLFCDLTSRPPSCRLNGLYLNNHQEELDRIWNLSTGDQIEMYAGFKRRQPLIGSNGSFKLKRRWLNQILGLNKNSK